jgi:hypothetical protein
MGNSERSLTAFEMTATDVLSFRPKGEIFLRLCSYSNTRILHHSIIPPRDLI